MSILKPFGGGTGWLKAGLLGFPKSGKSYTATILALGLRKYMNLTSEIVMLDTEGGSEYLAPKVKRETGKDLLGVRSRSFDDLMATAKEAEKIGASVLLVDSITHPWRELCDAHLKATNEVRRAKGRGIQTRMEFQDWQAVKAKWAPWTDFYLNSPLHIIICGRAGYEYDFEERDDDSGKKDLIKTGVKMKTEGEFGFEPSLLVLMSREQDMESGGRIVHRATVIGDRYAVIDGAQADNPGFDFFLPHIKCLSPGAHAPVDTSTKTEMDVDDNGDSQFLRERRDRVILCEEIQGELVRAWPGQTASEKKAKTEAIEAAFGTRSWTRVETFDAYTLRDGLEKIRAITTSAMGSNGSDMEVS